MSLEKKIRVIAENAALESMLNERGRCMWCLDEVMRDVRERMVCKVLTPAELHASGVRFEIANAVTCMARRAISSGIRPPSGGPDVAALSSEAPDA